MSAVVKSIKVEVQGKELELSVDEAVALHRELARLIDRRVSPFDQQPPTIQPIYIREGAPIEQRWPRESWDGTPVVTCDSRSVTRLN